MANTTLEAGLKRILGLCPDITLNSESIQEIIDGKINKVICEARGGTYVENEFTIKPVTERKPRKVATKQVVGKTVEIVTEDKTEDEAFTTTVTSTSNEDSDFEEYFTEK